MVRGGRMRRNAAERRQEGGRQKGKREVREGNEG